MFYFNLKGSQKKIKNTYDVFYVNDDNTLSLGFLYSHKGVNKILVDDEVYESGRVFVEKQNSKSLKDKFLFLFKCLT